MSTKEITIEFIDIINNITRPNYIMLLCNLDQYTCGRAFFINLNSSIDAQFVIYKTISEYDDNMDSDTLMHGSGNNSEYFKKYFKYKKHNKN